MARCFERNNTNTEKNDAVNMPPPLVPRQHMSRSEEEEQMLVGADVLPLFLLKGKEPPVHWYD